MYVLFILWLPFGVVDNNNNHSLFVRTAVIMSK